MQDDRKHVKLHVTIMNVVFVRRGKGGKAVRTFDATNIIDEFGNYEFGEQIIKELHLSKFGSSFANYYHNDGVLNIS